MITQVTNKTDHIFLLRDVTMSSALIFCFLCIRLVKLDKKWLVRKMSISKLLSPKYEKLLYIVFWKTNLSINFLAQLISITLYVF